MNCTLYNAELSIERIQINHTFLCLTSIRKKYLYLTMSASRILFILEKYRTRTMMLNISV